VLLDTARRRRQAVDCGCGTVRGSRRQEVEACGKGKRRQGVLRLTALDCLRWLAPRGIEGATCVTTWRRVPDFPVCASQQARGLHSTRTSSHKCWLAWAHQQVRTWRTTASTRYTCQCQYLDTAGNKGRCGHSTTGGARGAMPPSRCVCFCAFSWRCQRRGSPPVASLALALQRSGTPFAPLSTAIASGTAHTPPGQKDGSLCNSARSSPHQSAARPWPHPGDHDPV